MDASRGHKRKISFADLEATLRRAGPMQHGPPQAQQQAAAAHEPATDGAIPA